MSGFMKGLAQNHFVQATLAIAVFGMIPTAGAELALRYISQSTQTCTIKDSFTTMVGAGNVYVPRGGTTHLAGTATNYIKTKECGTLENMSGLPGKLSGQNDYKDTYCRLIPGDTVRLKTYHSLSGIDHPKIKEIGPIVKHDSNIVTMYASGPHKMKNYCSTYLNARLKSGLPIPS